MNKEIDTITKKSGKVSELGSKATGKKKGHFLKKESNNLV